MIGDRKVFEWYKITIHDRVQRLQYQPSAGHISSSQISLSPNSKQLALVYGEEGHPVIVVHDIRKMLDGKRDKLFGGGVYSGWLEFKCWKGTDIILESDQDLTRNWHDASPEVTGGGYFKINPVTYKIIRISHTKCSKSQ